MHLLNLPTRPPREIIENVRGGSRIVPLTTTAVPYFVSNCFDLQLNLSRVLLAQLTLERCKNITTNSIITVGRVITSVDFITCQNLELEFTMDQEMSLQLDHCAKLKLDLNELRQLNWTVFLYNCDQISIKFLDEWHLIPFPKPLLNAEGQSVNFRLKVSCRDEQLKVETCDQYGIVFEKSVLVEK